MKIVVPTVGSLLSSGVMEPAATPRETTRSRRAITTSRPTAGVRSNGSANTSASPETTIGIAIKMPISASPVMSPAANSSPWRSLAAAGCAPAAREVREEPAGEDRPC